MVIMSTKLSILMPTYNDAESIVETLESVRLQSNKNWELVVINDGSSDNTNQLIEDYIKKHQLSKQIKLINQENQDQLRAIIYGAQYITGDVVTVLHSDDLFYDEQVVEKILQLDFDKHDGYFCDLFTVDGASQPSGLQKFADFKPNDDMLVKTLLMYGRQQFADFFIVKRQLFESQVRDSYLTWNLPFYISMSADERVVANVRKADFFDRKYRIHEGNYINNELGKLNVINGELRTAVRLMRLFNIPAYRCQALFCRVFNKLKLHYPVFYQRQRTKAPHRVIQTILAMRFDRKYWLDNLFLKSLYDFYRHHQLRQIKIAVPQNEFIYRGCDMRRFNKAILNSDLSGFYQNILQEMQAGFSQIKCSQSDKEKVADIVKFLCLDGFVEIVTD